MIYVNIKDDHNYNMLFLLKTKEELAQLEQLVGTEKISGAIQPWIDGVFYDDYVTYGENNTIRFGDINENT